MRFYYNLKTAERLFLSMNKFYITTAIPYPNGKPHIGFGLEIVQADVLARYHRALGNDVWFLTGVDEHGLKVYRSAQEEGIGLQEYVDRNSAEFAKLKEVLNISYDDFIRTSDKVRHWPGAQKLWRACAGIPAEKERTDKDV